MGSPRLYMFRMVSNPGSLWIGTLGIAVIGGIFVSDGTPPAPKTAEEFVEFAQRPSTEPEEVMDAYNKAISMRPDFVEAYLGRGKLNIQQYYREKLSNKTNQNFARHHQMRQDYQKAATLNAKAFEKGQQADLLYQQAVSDYNKVKGFYQQQGQENGVKGINQLFAKVDKNYPVHNLCFPRTQQECLSQ
jgi:ABC-type glycerol-3-phosphate transport system substrate-binding protein